MKYISKLVIALLLMNILPATFAEVDYRDDDTMYDEEVAFNESSDEGEAPQDMYHLKNIGAYMVLGFISGGVLGFFAGLVHWQYSENRENLISQLVIGAILSLIGTLIAGITAIWLSHLTAAIIGAPVISICILFFAIHILGKKILEKKNCLAVSLIIAVQILSMAFSTWAMNRKKVINLLHGTSMVTDEDFFEKEKEYEDYDY